MTTLKTKAAPKAKATPAAEPKTTANTKKEDTAKTDAFAFPAASFESFGPAFKEMAESNLEKSKEAFEKFKAASEEAKDVFATSLEKSRASAIEMNEKTLSVAEQNTKAAMDHAKEVMGVKTFADAIELQTAFVKKQMDAFQDQTKSFQDLATKAAQEAGEPYKAAWEKSFAAFKAA